MYGYYSKKCLCGKGGRFKFDYKSTHGYLCLNHMQYWLSVRLPQLLSNRKVNE